MKPPRSEIMHSIRKMSNC